MKKFDILFVTRLVFGFFFGLLAFAQNVHAQATLSIQGVIKNSDGTAVDNGKYSLTFKLYEAESGGTPVWSETQDNIPVTGGIYSVLLGTTTPMTAAFDKTYFLGLSVEGGAELIPRAKLTSSPYALSLIGTGNTFPSSGTVGVGTASPTAGNELHVHDGAGEANVLVESASQTSRLTLKRGTKTGRLEVNADNQLAIAADNNQNMVFYVEGTGKLNLSTDNVVIANNGGNIEQYIDGSRRLLVHSGGVDVTGTLNVSTLNASNFSPSSMAISSQLAVGQGSVDPNNTLRVNGSSYLNGFVEINANSSRAYGASGSFYYFWGNAGGPGAWFGGSPYGYSLRTSNAISGEAFFSNSDRRIKTDIRLSNPFASLSKLQNLRVSEYKHIDFRDKGSDTRMGLIAQEVKEIFPEAVTTVSDFIPNVYALSTQTHLSNGQMTIVLDKNHEFSVGDEVRIETPNGTKKVFVAKIPSPNTFVTDWDVEALEKVFVYGKKVNDFHTVDYDRIFTLNVSATQELARRLMELEKQNASLRSEVGGLKTEAKNNAEKVEARLRALESKLSN